MRYIAMLKTEVGQVTRGGGVPESSPPPRNRKTCLRKLVLSIMGIDFREAKISEIFGQNCWFGQFEMLGIQFKPDFWICSVPDSGSEPAKAGFYWLMGRGFYDLEV